MGRGAVFYAVVGGVHGQLHLTVKGDEQDEVLCVLPELLHAHTRHKQDNQKTVYQIGSVHLTATNFILKGSPAAIVNKIAGYLT